MNESLKSESPEAPAMHHREITLEDGRYMIFYTFGEDSEEASSEENTENV